jgi:hypothetical protein
LRTAAEFLKNETLRYLLSDLLNLVGAASVSERAFAQGY